MGIKVKLKQDNFFRRQVVEISFDLGQFAGGVTTTCETITIQEAIDLRNKLNEILGDNIGI